ncbi:NAD(P)/FAD-dependent oxidoreductase [Oceanobacillus sp. J11TS1]|uniref:NAD(P)/FAD-dependent oxidoreductase n=1 Tax=Oceanobacillus sp. J11TS1 TaxID=2807191 RepID=UPI001B05EB71|nr:NAD(P)/FAD-dependent oxidoreductase [Oceanobacillus sp. J11TS1]GIO23326.1 ferredoxin--NADP reductase 1 [Oceanobacillus sp. J11TS1]
MNEEIYDVTIIGGGPAGLFAAFYSGMREMKTKIIEYLPYLGGKVPYFYPEKVIRDIGGIAHATGEEVTEQLVKQAMTFDPAVVLGEQVVDMQRMEDGNFQLVSSNGNTHYSKTIMLATGFGTLHSVKLDHPEAVYYEEKSLHYTVRKLADYYDKHVLISGGGNSAVDWALELENIAKSVTLIHRRDQFKGLESSVTKLKNARVNVMTPYEIKELHGTDGQIKKVTLKHLDNAAGDKELYIDRVVVNHGFQINLEPITSWGLEMIDGMIAVDSSMQTSVEGVFAIGDIAHYPNKLGLIAGAFNEGPIAVNHAKKIVAPEDPVNHLFSTNFAAFTEEE